MSTHGGGAARSRGYGPHDGNAGYGRTVEEPGSRLATLTRDMLTTIAGRELGPGEVADLMGAQPGSRVVYGPAGQIKVHGPDDSSYHELMVHPGAPGEHGILLWQSRRGTDQAAAWPPEVLADMVKSARALGFGTIHAKVRSGSPDAVELPRLGFDAPVNANFRAEMRRVTFPDPAPDPPGGWHPRGDHTMLSDLLAQPGGPAWYAANVANPGLDFYLSGPGGTHSLDTLNVYLAQHGLPGI